MTMPTPTHDTIGAKVARATFPAYGWCGRCGYPWRLRQGHSTPYSGGKSMFPLCELCWAYLQHPEARIPYYAALVEHWLSITDEERRGITKAVTNGL